ncbi:hypothetical protein [Luteimicrobium sp. DT211]|uniref:hypothetical protein n=1 Tax=Luteimicrobium sp. DT211 TaxID=3393412 RepID=UPI003CF0BE37
MTPEQRPEAADDEARLEAWFAGRDADEAPDAGGGVPFEDASIPVGGGAWRAVAGAGWFWYGSVVLAVALVGWVVVAGGATIRAARAGSPLSAADTLAAVGWVGVVVGGLVVMSLVWVAELGRRGRVARSTRERTTLLPQGTNVARIRPLGIGWHVAWLVLLVALTVLFVGVGLDGRWFLDEPDDGSFAVLWWFCGLVTGFVSGVLLVSLVKKLALARRARRGAPAPERPSAFWRWFDYRWRFDLWLSGLGAAAVSMGAGVAWLVASTPDGEMSSGDAHAFAVLQAALLAGGVPLLLVGLWCGLQYWRSGEALGSGESFA